MNPTKQDNTAIELEQIQMAHWADEGEHLPEKAVCPACTKALLTLITNEKREAFEQGVISERLWWAKNRNNQAYSETGVFDDRIAKMKAELKEKL